MVSLLQAQFLTLFSSLSLSLCLSLSFPSLPPTAPWGRLLLSPWLVGCPPRPPGREGRMVVLSLVLGLSEQDDFANIPDLQNPGTQQNQNAQGDKRYAHGRGPAAVAEKEAWRGCQPRSPAAGRGGGAFCGCWSGRTTRPQPAPSHPPRWWCPLGPEASVAVLGPFWIKPAPRACLPLPGASQPFGPIFLLGSPSAAPSSFISVPPNPEIPVSLAVGGRQGC